MTDSLAIELKNVRKSFGATSVIKGLSLKIQPRTITALVGESGCGKTTCLRLMNGLIQPDDGEVWVDGEPFDYRRSVETRRRMGYCLQGYTLFPHMSVYENVSLIAAKLGWAKSDLRARAQEVLELVQLPPKENMDKKPNQLSGGQRQRVGLARALFLKPKILLMDEPFGALDPITRGEIQDAVMELQKKLDLTVVLVTHDLSEAFKMAETLVLLQAGSVAQVGRPNRLLSHPANHYVEDFLKTNSPGHLLKSIFVSQVMTQEVVVVKHLSAGSVLVEMENQTELPVSDERDIEEALRKYQQGIRIEVNSEFKLTSAFDLHSGKQLKLNQVLRDRTDLLTGLNKFMKEDVYALPVLNAEGKVLGVFTRSSLDLLDQGASV